MLESSSAAMSIGEQKSSSVSTGNLLP